MGYLCSGFIFINFNQSFLLCRGILIEAVFPCIRRKFARRVQFMWKLTTHEIDLGNFWNRKPKSRSFPPELTRRKLLEECQYSILAPVSNLTQFHFFQLTYNSYISHWLWISLCTEHDSVIIWVHAKVLILDRTIGNCKIEMHVHCIQFMWVCLVGSTNANITTNLFVVFAFCKIGTKSETEAIGRWGEALKSLCSFTRQSFWRISGAWF